MGDPTESHGYLFPVFLLSLLQFFLVPITTWRVGSWQVEWFRGEFHDKTKITKNVFIIPTDVTSEWGKAQAARSERAKGTFGRKLRASLSVFNLVLSVGWIISALLAVHIVGTQGREAEYLIPTLF